MRLLAALMVLFGLTLPAAAGDQIGAKDARQAALAGEMLLVDIRTPEEWASTGLPDVAYPINLRGEGFAVKLKKLMDDNPGKPVAVICASGGRSTFVSEALSQRGIDVLNVREGMMGSDAGPGWLNRSLPVRAPGMPRTEIE